MQYNNKNMYLKVTLKVNGLSKINGTSGYGNNALNYPVGLITADEVALAGSVYNVMNSKYYLYTANSLWTLTPLTFLTTYIQSRNAFVEQNGKLNNGILNYELYIRPVNLKVAQEQKMIHMLYHKKIHFSCIFTLYNNYHLLHL